MNEPKKHILLIDDNKDIRDTIRLALEEEHFTVTSVGNAQGVLSRLPENNYDLILLDLVLPDDNGLNLISRIREHSAAPIVIVSGKGELVDKVLGLEMGADDYISKPFQIKELTARVKARLRATSANEQKPAANNPAAARKISFGCWTMDRERLQVFGPDKESANLTVKEFKLLEAFVASPNIVLTREQLLDKSRLNDFNVTDRAIDTQIARIRKKLGDTAENGIIQSIRGAGYMFSAPLQPFSE